MSKRRLNRRGPLAQFPSRQPLFRQTHLQSSQSTPSELSGVTLVLRALVVIESRSQIVREPEQETLILKREIVICQLRFPSHRRHYVVDRSLIKPDHRSSPVVVLPTSELDLRLIVDILSPAIITHLFS